MALRRELKEVELYRDDYGDYGWYHICLDSGVIDYEYNNGTDHQKIDSITLRIASVRCRRSACDVKI